ncbi:hypothetical protein ACQCT5_04565 [Sutcliffiella halmapala]
MSNLHIKERFYFSYSKKESDYLKDNGVYYLTKGIHPQTKVVFTMYDRDERLLESLKEFRQLNAKAN